MMVIKSLNFISYPGYKEPTFFTQVCSLSLKNLCIFTYDIILIAPIERKIKALLCHIFY